MRRARRAALALLAASSAALALAPRQGREPEWPTYGGDLAHTRWSPLAQVDTATVATLRVAWRWRSSVYASFEATPIVVGGTMYVALPWNGVAALDAATGAVRWRWQHRHDRPRSRIVRCCGPVNRGVAVAGGMVFVGTLDGRLVALDVATGRERWNVPVASNDSGYAITAAPVVARDLVLIGAGGGEYGVRGFLAAFDRATGTERWRFHTIPSPEDGGWWGTWREHDAFGTPLHRDVARERADSARHADAWRTGGAAVWQAPAIDTARGLAIFATGNPAPDVDGTVRPGDNLHANSIVAVDLRTGRLRWAFQEVPHDRWDYDAASPVVLLDLPDERGRTRAVAVQAGKSGWVYVVDRATGAPLRRSDEVVPHANVFAPPTREGTLIRPGADGGVGWSPAAWSARTRLLYVVAADIPTRYFSGSATRELPRVWRGGNFVREGAASGAIVALDPATGRIAWRHPLDRPTVGGALATAGGLVFAGTADGRLLALHDATGRVLWEGRARFGVNAPPITYAVSGRQYVAVAAGGNSNLGISPGDEVIVFSLP